MERKSFSSSASSMASLSHILLLAVVVAVSCSSSRAADESKVPFEDNFSKSCPDTNFKTSEDGQTWYLSLNKQAGTLSLSLYNVCIHFL